jgi:iron complex outermembrane receptor protein
MDRSKFLRSGGIAAALMLLSVHAPAVCAQEKGLADMSLQELAELPVTSVSKKPESLADAAASVYVITNDDIRRSGARILPEALRLAPNLEVAQANNGTWMVSARGTDAASADKMLVLIDGRIVYSPLFAGVFWDVQQVMLEDVDRIEVISGPGGTLWGTNAVNGVINIISKRAGNTESALLSAGAGRRGADGAVRWGGRAGEVGAYRVYALMSDDYPTTRNTDAPMPDGLRTSQAGFRADWVGAVQQLNLQGDMYETDEDMGLPLGGARMSGFNLMSHWDDNFNDGSALSATAYYDHNRRYEPGNVGDDLDIADLELQQVLPAWMSQRLTWGASWRYAMDAFENLPTSGLNFQPASVDQNWESFYAQNESVLSPAWRLITGARLERNPYTGTEVLPNIRLAWKPDSTDLLWAAASRAVRSPARLDTNVYSPQQAPFFLVGDGGFESETVRVYEAGYRAQPAERWSYSVTVYHDDSDHLRTTTVLSAAPLQVTFGNQMTATRTGIETWANYQPLDNWRLSAGFSANREDFTLQPTALPTSISAEGDDARNQWQLRSSYDFANGMELDVSLRHVGQREPIQVPAYTTGDVRVGWTVWEHWECSLLAQNLFGPAHIEFGPTGTAEFGRGLYARLTWRP